MATLKTGEVVNLSLLKKKLNTLSEQWLQRRGLCFGGVYTLDGKIEIVQGHGACHSWVNQAFHPYYENKRKPQFAVLTCHRPDFTHATPEANTAVIKWMASPECPFSKYILNKDDEESLLDGAIILCGGKDGASENEALWMCKVLRYSREGSKALDTWHTLVKGGVNPFLAIYVATHITAVKGATFGFSEVPGHGSVFVYYSYSGKPNDGPDFTKLLKGEADRDSPDTRKLFGVVTHSFNPKAKIQGFCKGIEKSDGWGGTVKGKGATGEELVENVLEWQRELEKEAGITATFPYGHFDEEAAPVELAAKKVVRRVVAKKPALAKPAAKMPGKNTVFLDLDL